MDNKNFLQEEISHCVAALRAGKTILYPTDTVWGIGCDALQGAAVAQVFELKQRSLQKSMIILLSDVAQLDTYTDSVRPEILEFIKKTAAPTTVIFDKAKNLPANVINGDGSIAIRVTRDPFCRELINQLGSPLISTSANRSGGPAAAFYAQVDKAIVNGVGYVVRYRQDDEQPAAPSQIVRFGAGGELIRLR